MLLRRYFSHSGSGFHFFPRNKVGLAALLVFQHVVLGGVVVHEALEGVGVVVLAGIHADQAGSNVGAVIRDTLCIVQHILRLKDGVCSIDTGVVFLDVLNNARCV